MADKVGAVMVVGGGIAGIQASLDLAESGYYVYLVESSPAIGGVMAQLDKTFPTNDCSMCILSPKLVEAGRHLNIQLITHAELKEVRGEAGRFEVKLLKRPRYIDLEKCTGCGLCAESQLPEELKKFEADFWVDRVKIDESKCIQCGDCVSACVEENKKIHGITNIAFERRRFLEIPSEEREGKKAETLMQELALMDISARNDFWRKELSKCIKCYGCRNICPLCICDECELEDPEWVTPGKIPPDFPLFHLIRAYHLADRCIGCGECEATCPMNIPLLTIQNWVCRQDPEIIFAFVPGLEDKTKEKLIGYLKKKPINERGVRR